MKKSVAEAHRILSNIYGEAAISERTRREWFQRFKNGDFDVEDQHGIWWDQLGVVYYELLKPTEKQSQIPTLLTGAAILVLIIAVVCAIQWKKYRETLNAPNAGVSPLLFFCPQRRRRLLRERIPLNPTEMIMNPNYSKDSNNKEYIIDGATCHTARATIDLLKDTFGDRLISRFGPVNWPPRSCDLTPLDYFLRGYVKSLVYVDTPQTLDHLEDNIRRVIADIRPQMLEKVIENWTSRLDYFRACRGSHLPEIIFRM
ncbi:transposable element Tc3 transposase [Trichonephila clavipes]|nr:transposable element Tc3 transposase [Trichonephila clavipes]